MKTFKETIQHLKSKHYYVRLMEILVVNGLLDIFEEELRDNKIDYLPLIINVLNFLQENKKHYRNFSSDTLENIIILSVDEIMNKKFKIDLDEKQLQMALELVKNSYLMKSVFTLLSDTLIKIYYKCKCKTCYGDIKDVDIEIDLDKSRHPVS